MAKLRPARQAHKGALEHRIADLRQGLRQWYGDDLIYAAPGEVERLAHRFGEVLHQG